MLDPALFGEFWGGGLEEHQRTEAHFVPRYPPDHVKDDRGRDGGASDEKQWIEKTHASIMRCVLFVGPRVRGACVL